MLLLPLSCLVLLTLLLYRRQRLPLTGALLLAGVLVATTMFLMNQLLSVGGRLTAGHVSLAWAVLAAVLAGWSVATSCNRRHLRKIRRHLPGRLHTWRSGVSRFGMLVAGVIVVVSGVTLVTAVLALPNNYDSMSYHLPRIMHWLQNAQISIFPTNIDRQIYQHPGAEHLQLQFFLLTGGLGSAMNLVQWLSMIGCVLAAGLIAAELGGKEKDRWIAMGMVATWPMVIFQSTGTKNDLLMSCMVMAGLWQILRLARPVVMRRTCRMCRLPSMMSVVVLSFILGWVLLVKGTGYVFLPPLLLGLCWVSWRRGGVRLTALLSGTACLVIVAMMTSPWLMNHTAFGSVLGPVSDSYRPSGNLLAAGVVNAVRDTGSQLTTPVETANQLMLTTMTRGLSVMGLDINDVHSMNYNDRYFLFGLGVLSEDHAGAPWHMVWILLMLPLIAWRGRGVQRAYLLLWLVAAAMFCVLVSWNEWINRLTLPLMLCALPLVGVALHFENWRPRYQRALILSCLVMATPALLFNYNRSLLGSTSLLTHSSAEAQFMAQPDKQRSIAEAVAQIRMRSIHRLGLVFAADEMEYPFWQELVWRDVRDSENHRGGMRLVHRGVTNTTAGFREPSFVAGEPLAWLLVSSSRVQSRQMMIDGAWYNAVWSGDGYALYRLTQKSE